MNTPILTSWRAPKTELSIRITRWLYTAPVQEQYIEHPRSLWLLWNYLKKVGARSVIQKLRSRFSENKRNQKIFGVGVGLILESPSSSNFVSGSHVLFFAPNHPSDTDILCIHEAFVVPVSLATDQSLPSTENSLGSCELPDLLLQYVGWSPYSGFEIDVENIQKTLLMLEQKCSSALKKENCKFIGNLQITEQINVDTPTKGKPTAVLFGLGNYAKTAIIPNIRSHISLQRVHEIDPDQLAFFGKKAKVSMDTAPYPRTGLTFDAWFIAGFHHTHTDLAIEALRQSAYAVIEKPLATTRLQYEKFSNVMTQLSKARFFLCFHKRYSELHSYAMHDLDSTPGDPVDMHCIVYEIPLPRLHWYNWPNSGSRLISNGCHWIDYFMYINGYSKAVDYRVWRPRGSDVSVQVRLENGAYLTMSLTDTGSQRLGVRDHIELRKGGVTVKMVDGAYYEAESRTRVLRKKKVNPLNSYAQMYRHIGKSIATGADGDSLESLRSSELTLILEDLII